MSVCVPSVCSMCGDQKEVSDPPELECQVVFARRCEHAEPILGHLYEQNSLLTVESSPVPGKDISRSLRRAQTDHRLDQPDWCSIIILKVISDYKPSLYLHCPVQLEDEAHHHISCVPQNSSEVGQVSVLILAHHWGKKAKQAPSTFTWRTSWNVWKPIHRDLASSSRSLFLSHPGTSYLYHIHPQFPAISTTTW